jgi:hypothetical protein
MAGETPRKFRLITADREAKNHANVSPITLQFCEFDRLRTPQGLPEVWIRIFFDQCAKLGGFV